MARIWEGKDIFKSYRNHSALERISITFEAGECVSLCGGNGAGKSTLIQIIAGVLQPSGGSINRSQDLRIGYMPDSLNFPGKVTAKEFLCFMAKLKHCGEHEVSDKLETVGLTGVAEKPISTFSKGMQQRLLLAQALLGEPPLLLLDEPSNGLDPFWIALWKQILLNCKQAGQTIIFSSHVLHDVIDLADRIILFNEGRLIDDSPVHAWKEAGYPFDQLFFAKLFTRDR